MKGARLKLIDEVEAPHDEHDEHGILLYRVSIYCNTCSSKHKELDL